MATVGSSPEIATRCHRCARLAIALVIAISTTVCTGWILGSPALRPLVSMKLNTSLALLFIAAATWLSVQRGEVMVPARRRAARALAMLSIAIAAATLTEDMLAIDLGIDQLLCEDPAATGVPGRMSPITGGCLLVLGAAVIWLETWWAEWLALLGAVVAHLALLGYLYGVPDLYAIKPFNSVALHTAVALGVLGLGIILARPQRGIVRVVSSDSPGGMLARRLLPAAVAAPAALALALQWGEHAGLYGGGFGRAMLVLCSTVLFAVLIWGTAAALTHVDQRRRAAEDDVRTSEARKTVLLAELVRSSDRLRVLSQVSDAFAAVATSYQALIDQVARTVAKIVGDGCMVTLLSDDGERLFNAANAHRDPALESDYKAYLAGLSLPVATSTAIAAAVVRTGQPRRADVQPDAIVAHSDDALKPVVARLNIHGFAVVAIRVRHAVIGTLSVQRSEPNRSYTDDDVTLLQDLADRAGLAIENARLYGQLEQRVRERTRELEIANGELEAFSYSVAHDLRAPLRGIAGFSRTVIEDYADRLPADGVGHLTRIEAGAQRMALLIDDLLDLARVSRAQLRSSRVDLSAMARTAIARLQAEQPVRNVEIVVEDGLVAQADPGLLDIALTNLLDNAWKFTGKRARARIELAACADQRPRTFFIRDNGAGFEAKYAAKLFGVFERLHPANEFEGTGIGLAIARRIIDRHGGRIWAESTVGEGATFFFTLETAVASDARQ